MDETPKGRNDEHQFDYSKITDNVYIGSDLCKGGVCLIHADEFKKLGVTLELNLSRENNELPPKELKVGYMWLPVTDGYAPTPVQLDMGSYILNSAVENGEIVYVHCKNGHGRSPTLVVAYLMRYKGYNLETAEKLLCEKRPEAHLEEDQKKALLEFAARWSK